MRKLLLAVVLAASVGLLGLLPSEAGARPFRRGYYGYGYNSYYSPRAYGYGYSPYGFYGSGYSTYYSPNRGYYAAPGYSSYYSPGYSSYYSPAVRGSYYYSPGYYYP